MALAPVSGTVAMPRPAMAVKAPSLDASRKFPAPAPVCARPASAHADHERAGSVRRPEEAKIFAQRLAFVFGVEKAAALELRHELIDQRVDGAGHVARQHVEPVSGAFAEPGFELVGDLLDRADESPVMLGRGRAHRHLTQAQALAAGNGDVALDRGRRARR